MEEKEILSYLNKNDKKIYLSLDPIGKFAFRYGFIIGRIVQLDKDNDSVDKSLKEGFEEGLKEGLSDVL